MAKAMRYWSNDKLDRELAFAKPSAGLDLASRKWLADVEAEVKRRLRRTMKVERFTAKNDSWYSVVVRGDLATGVMHATKAAAETEMNEIGRGANG